MTIGIIAIMQAKRLLLIAGGADKADIMAKALTGPITPFIPASILQLHPDLIVVADEAVLSEMEWTVSGL
ncbi:MAG: hypothetical protein E4H44_05525 [Candidatus Aminicenantes bacterium]|nr:MAG: hypothetical protein E4H44_05525 [Candidatus Aminicenantes bacterium]